MPNEPQAVSDEALARETQGGSLSAFEELVHRYEARIYRFVANNCRNDADAREVTQETFLSAFRKIDRFDSRRAFVTWLFTIARRKCIDRHRAARFADGELLPEQADEETPHELLARRESEEDLWRRARNVLSERHYQLLWLRYAEDLSVADIARVIRRTRTHVKVMLFRARLALAKKLKATRAKRSVKLLNRKPQALTSKLTGIVRAAMF
jgi:RNA polymerase sigma-70 factor, ECF subfamily